VRIARPRMASPPKKRAASLSAIASLENVEIDSISKDDRGEADSRYSHPCLTDKSSLRDML
jgi:hypothetical protein